MLTKQKNSSIPILLSIKGKSIDLLCLMVLIASFVLDKIKLFAEIFSKNYDLDDSATCFPF